MNLRHSLSLTVSSVTLVLKVLIYTTVLFLIAFSLFMAITEPIIESFGEDFDLIAEIEEDLGALAGQSEGGPLKAFVESNSDDHLCQRTCDAVLHPDHGKKDPAVLRL